MESTANNNELKRVRMVFFINLAVSIIYLLIVFRSINTEVTWRIICSAIGFTGIFAVTVMVFLRLMQLQKAAKNNA